ncbi:MAG: hypothetical protein ACREU3_05985 [Steroidobacteraceae bacterium]
MRPLASLASIAREIIGLFVDDGSYALSILVWLAVVALVLKPLGIGQDWLAVILFGGLAAILIESALRRSRR